MKLSHYVAEFLANAGLHQVFMLTGGGAMHLNDALGKHPKLEVIFNHHEQACAMAAEGYGRLTQRPAVVNITTGPGGINTLNGVFGAWTDSIPMLVLSGQVRFDTTIASVGLPELRQMGDQEADIVPMVKGITKYAVSLIDPSDIRYHLQKALYLSTHGRPGPVWLDIPLNIQGADIDPSALRAFDPQELAPTPEVATEVVETVLAKLKSAERPVVMLGTGVRIAGMQPCLLQWLERLAIPVVTAFNAHDALPDHHRNYVGRPGTVGDRSGNFAVQNADVLLVLGCRLNIRQIGYHWSAFARAAYKIMVDVDAAELQKPTLAIDLPIQADLADFLPKMVAATDHPIAKPEWLAWCKARQAKYPVVLPEYWHHVDTVNPYCFIEALSDALNGDDVVVTANATACISAFQAFKIKAGQRLFSNSGSASMGYGLPAAIGACLGHNRARTICLEGDGSLMMNIQELATVAHYRLPLKLFLLNNQGYHSIRQTQKNFFGEPLVGVGPDSGVSFPNFAVLAQAFGLRYSLCRSHDDLPRILAETLQDDDPVLCEVLLDPDQAFAPKSSSKRLADGRIVSKPLEDLAPFLSRAELLDNMQIPLLDDE